MSAGLSAFPAALLLMVSLQPANAHQPALQKPGTLAGFFLAKVKHQTPPKTARQPLCYPAMTHKATHRFPAAARSIAIHDWKDHATRAYGKDYNIWSIARNRSLRCTRNSKQTTTCTARARPCRIVDFKLK